MRFIPNCQTSPSGLVIRPKNNNIFYGSHRINYESISVNDITHPNLEPTLIFGTAWEKHLIHIWNLRISYPFQEIQLMDDKVSSDHKQLKYNPEVAAAFCTIFQKVLLIACGQ